MLRDLAQKKEQSAGEDNSTQMYYAKLIIEKEAIGNITHKLTSIVNNVTLQVHEAQMTTRCQNVSSNTECSCESGYRWSDKVCQSKKCCGNSTCIFPQNSSHMCVSDTTVNITGSVTITGTSHQDCLAEKDSEQFQTCNNNLLQKMKKVYSTLTGFDVLKITKYSVGSIIVDFEMIIVSNLKPEALINKSNALTETLSGLLKLETTGNFLCIYVII
ncbi:adhesion G protein-coupled receptor F5-like [Trachinotus anak]|uniref:adhesion G protein-coupled receptor F5-like n=1 Tax=Trachinotus anak TaxID=443729 RepID=UPI0039F183BB